MKMNFKVKRLCLILAFCFLCIIPIVLASYFYVNRAKGKCIHEVITEYGYEATCTKKGKTDGTRCTKCNEMIVPQEVLPPTGHSWINDYEIIPTCTEDGYLLEKYCEKCGEYVKKREKIDALGHDYINRECQNCHQYLPSEGLEFSKHKSLDGYTLVGIGTCQDEHVVIPSEYNGKAVVEVSREALRENEKILSLVIPGSVSIIQDGSFSRMYNLEKVVFCEGVSTLPDYALNYCLKLKTVVLPNSLYEIENNVFSNCKSLESVIMHDNVNYVGEKVFSECISLKSIKLSEKMPTITSMMFQKCSALREITIPASVESIEPRAFSECSSLEIVNITSGLRRLENEAFSGCTALKELSLPKTLTEFDSRALNNSAVKKLSLYSSINILRQPELAKVNLNELTVHGDFNLLIGKIVRECNVETVKLTGGKNIDKKALEGCTFVKKIYIPSTVVSIEKETFAECTSLTDIYCSHTVKPLEWDDEWNLNCGADIHWAVSVVS